MGKIVVVRPDGSKTEVTREQAEKLRVLGYREESQEEYIDRAVEASNKEHYSQPMEKLETVAEGWAGAATLGVSDKLNPDIEGARQRAKYNPIHRIGGEVGAGVLGSVVIPGAGARTIGGRVAAEGIVGGVFGAGNALTESALSGDPLTVTSVLAHGGVGALLGTGTGLAGESIIGVAKKLKGRGQVDEVVDVFEPGKDTLSPFYKSLPKEKIKKGKDVPDWIKAGKDTPDDTLIREFTEEITTPIGKTVKETYDIVPDADFQKFHRNVRDISDLYETTMEDVEKQLLFKQKEVKELNRYLKSAGKRYHTAGKLTSEFNASVVDPASSMAKDMANKAAFLDDHYKVFSKALKEGDSVKALRRLDEYKKMLKEAGSDEIFEGGALPSMKKVEAQMSEIKALEDAIKVKAAARELSSFPDTASGFSRMTADRAERLFASADLLAKQPEPIFKSALNSVDEMLFAAGVSKSGSPGERLRALYEIGKNSSFKQTATKRVFNEVKKEVPRARFEHPEKTDYSSVMGKTAAPAPKPEPKYQDLFESTVDFGIDSPGASNVIRGTKSGGYTSKQSFFGRIARLASARKASALAKHAGMGVGGSAAAYELGGALAGAITGGGLLAGVAGVKAAVVGKIASGVVKYGPGIGTGVKKIGARVDPLYTRIDGTIDARQEDKDRKKALKARIDEINAIGPGAKDAAFFAVQPLMGEYPEFAKGLHDAFVTAFNGLITFIPRDPGLATSRGKSLWSPSDVQMRQTEKALSVFHDPIGAIESILNGAADVIVVKALKTMYPPLYEEMRNGLVSKMMDPAFLNSLSYADQARLAIMTEIPLHSSFTPRSIAQSQSIYARASQNRPAPTNSGGGSGGRPQKMEPPTAGQSLAGK